jgi:hypothetical protein
MDSYGSGKRQTTGCCELGDGHWYAVTYVKLIYWRGNICFSRRTLIREVTSLRYWLSKLTAWHWTVDNLWTLQEIPCFVWNPNICNLFHKKVPSGCILNRFNPINIPTRYLCYYFYRYYLSVSLSHTHTHTSDLVPENFLCIFHFSTFATYCTHSPFFCLCHILP